MNRFGVHMQVSSQTMLPRLSICNYPAALFYSCRKSLSKHIDEFDKYADRFEQLEMRYMNFHGKESIDTVIEVLPDCSLLSTSGVQFLETSEYEMNIVKKE